MLGVVSKPASKMLNFQQIRALSILALVGLLALTAACCGKQKNATVAASAAGPGLYQVPHVTLVAVTDWQAVLKPCGCTVDLQKGGVERIARYIADLRKTDDSVLVVHAGSLLADDEAMSSPQKRAQLARRLQAFTDILQHVQIAAVALSGADLQMGGADTKAQYESVPWPVLSAGWQASVANAKASTLVKTASGVQVGLLGIDPAAGDEAAQQKAVTTEVVALRKQGAQVVVVLSNLGLRFSRRLARVVPGIDVVVVGKLDDKMEPETDLEREGNTLIVQSTRHGAYFSTVTLAPQDRGPGPSRDGQGGWREASAWLPGATQELQQRIEAMQKQLAQWRQKATVATLRALPHFEHELADLQRRLVEAKQAANQPLPAGRLAAYRTVGLLWTAPVDEQAAAIVKKYDADVAELNLKNAGDVPPVKAGEAGFVGQKQCMVCHEELKDFVANDLHRHAWETLEKVNKTKDLDCVPCHATGYGMPGGSVLGKLGVLTGVQCEACHGPGSLHVAAPGKGPNSHILAVPKVDVCTTCHTTEHAPRFAFDEYRKRLLVPGHGLPLPKAP